MNVIRTIAAGVTLGWICQNSIGGQPPGIDRPSPPPCCADGQCLASPLTHGYYATRWRRWPLEAMAQAPTTQPAALPAPVRDDVLPYVTPQPELEDRKAPPPSVPAGEQTPAAVPSGVSRTPSAPGAPPQQGGFPPAGGRGLPTPPPPSSTTPPGGQETQPNTGPIYKNVSPDSPLNRSGPMGDADPPPSLPFGPALVAPEQPSRDVSQQPAELPAPSRAARPLPVPSSDPPPALPIALASYDE